MTSEASTETARGKVQRQEPTKPQRAAARRIAESKATIPHVYMQIDAQLATDDVDDVEKAAIVVRAAALALREHPRLNGAYRDGGFESYSRINVGVVIGAGQDAVIPTIFDADTKPKSKITAELADLAGRIAAGALASPELAGGTFTVSAVAGGRVRSATPIINQGQAAALAIGALAERPIVQDGTVVGRPMFTITVACDARIIGVGEGSAFLDAVRSLVEEPERLA